MLARTAARMATVVDRPFVRYAIAALAVAAAIAARMALGMVFETPIYFTTFLPAILIVALLSGWLPAVVALAASILVAWWGWMGTPFSWDLGPGDDFRILSFMVAVLLEIAFCEVMRVAVRRGFAAEERFRIAQENALDGFVILEPIRRDGKVVDLRWIYANPAADLMAPSGTAPLTGKRVIEVFPDRTARDMIERLATVLKQDRPDDLQVSREIDGTTRWLRSTAVRLGDQVAVSFRDITEVVEARRDLEARVSERTAELHQAHEERLRAEAALAQAQRLETVGRLTGGVAHDFNNLLTVIIGGLDVVLKSSDPARRERMANAALAAARRGERLTRQLLAFSRRQELRLEVADIGDLVAQMEPLIRRAANELVSLSIEIEPGACHARLDPAQFEAALLNLVVNAADATSPGQAITVSAGRARLEQDERPGALAGDYVRVMVADTGAGMSPDVLARVFEPFFTTKEVGKGTGLGLAQVYGFARQVGGVVDIASTPGEGTCVALFLPVADAPAMQPQPLAEPQFAGPVGVRLLLVEDDDGVRQVFEAQLADLGCRVISEPNAIGAKARLDSGEAFDLLLSDIVMPGGMSGLDLAAYVEAMPSPPLILLTSGYAGDDADPVQAPWPVLRKPFSGEQLAAALHATLQTRPAA